MRRERETAALIPGWLACVSRRADIVVMLLGVSNVSSRASYQFCLGETEYANL
jgi:hypothetical protein